MGTGRISSSLTSRVSIIKGYIRNSHGKGFDGDGYVFKEAIRQLRKEGWAIRYDRKQGLYFAEEEI